jgi:hypothetical protein
MREFKTLKISCFKCAKNKNLKHKNFTFLMILIFNFVSKFKNTIFQFNKICILKHTRRYYYLNIPAPFSVPVGFKKLKFASLETVNLKNAQKLQTSKLKWA